MRTAVTQESIESYHAHRASGKLSAQQERVMLYLHKWPRILGYSLQELSGHMGIAVHVLSARVNELIKLRYLERTDKRRCTVSGKSCRPVRIRPEQLRLL